MPSAVNKTPIKLNNDKILKIAASNAYTKTIGLKQHYEDEGINSKRPPVQYNSMQMTPSHNVNSGQLLKLPRFDMNAASSSTLK